MVIGHGNSCDGDFNNELRTNIFDLFAFKGAFGNPVADAQFDLEQHRRTGTGEYIRPVRLQGPLRPNTRTDALLARTAVKGC